MKIPAMLLLILVISTSQIAFSFSDADDQNHDSLKEILENRSVGDPIVCPNPQHILVQRPNLDWSCVYPETADKLGWNVVLYEQYDAPKITTSVVYGDEPHSITHQTGEGVVDSIQFFSDVGYGIYGYFLEISVSPSLEGTLTITHPSVESHMFENYCRGFNNTPDAHYFLYLVDGFVIDPVNISTNSSHTTVNLHYASNASVIEIILACHI